MTTREDLERRITALEEKAERLKQLEKENEELGRSNRKLLAQAEDVNNMLMQIESLNLRLKAYSAFDELVFKMSGEIVDDAIQDLESRWATKIASQVLEIVRKDKGKLSSSDISIKAEDMTVKVEHTDIVQEFTTKTGLGKILYVVLAHREGKPMSETEISEDLREFGWPMGHSTLAPNLGQLVRQGLLVKESTKPNKYRSPAKISTVVKKV